MRTSPPLVFKSAQCYFDLALRSSLERIVTVSRPGFGDWQWRLATLPFAFGGIGVYSAGDVLNYAFLASRPQFAGLQTKLLLHTRIVASGPIFDDALCVFNTSIETDLLSYLSDIAAPKLMKKMADIYFTRVTKIAESTFSLSPRQMALWKSQREDHTSDWLRTVPISGLGQTMNACSRVFAGDIYGDHVVSCAGIIGIRHHHNIVRDTLVDTRISSGLDVCVDLTGSSPLTQTGMTDFVPGHAVIDVEQHKCVKYMAKCAAIGYVFLPFSFSSLGELKEDAVFSMNPHFPYLIDKWPCGNLKGRITLLISLDHAVSCDGIIGIKHRHNVVRDTLVNICFSLRILACKEVYIGLDGGCDKPLRPADMLLYLWDGGLDVCVDLTGSSPLTQTGMTDFVPGRAVIDVAQRKRVKYMAKCAAIGYVFLHFSFSSLGELKEDAVTLLKRIRKFSIVQDIWACVAVHIFNRISFAIAKGVKTHIVSRLPTIFLSQNHDFSHDFMLGRAVIDAAHHKWVKYEAKCADIGYGFLPFSFSSLGELDKDAVTLLKQI
ncbi:hypothetical protein Tco_0453185 [Tanacetum coccineum]